MAHRALVTLRITSAAARGPGTECIRTARCGESFKIEGRNVLKEGYHAGLGPPRRAPPVGAAGKAPELDHMFRRKLVTFNKRTTDMYWP